MFVSRMNMSESNTDYRGMANPPLRACRPQNVCGACFNFWLRCHVVVPTDLPPVNRYCPAVLGPGGLSFPCLKVDDLMDVEEIGWQLDLKLIEDYPMNLGYDTSQQSRPSGM